MDRRAIIIGRYEFQYGTNPSQEYYEATIDPQHCVGVFRNLREAWWGAYAISGEHIRVLNTRTTYLDGRVESGPLWGVDCSQPFPLIQALVNWCKTQKEFRIRPPCLTCSYCVMEKEKRYRCTCPAIVHSGIPAALVSIRRRWNRGDIAGLTDNGVEVQFVATLVRTRTVGFPYEYDPEGIYRCSARVSRGK